MTTALIVYKTRHKTDITMHGAYKKIGGVYLLYRFEQDEEPVVVRESRIVSIKPMNVMEKRRLVLSIKKKWFDMIASGIKKEEYREIKPFYDRLKDNEFDELELRNGYGFKVPNIVLEMSKIYQGMPEPEWTDKPDEKCYVLLITKIISNSHPIPSKKEVIKLYNLNL